ncbi:MAG TPA: cysteine hydrolase [Spirochaetes bacterium]|nr:cysteine hydrolase [Spirochaetota bacterium]
MSEALVIIDVQKDYFPGGRMEVVNSENATQMAKSLLSIFRKNNKNIVHIQHVSTREEATFFLPETDGVEIHESVSPLAGEKIITKHFPNSFRGTDLEDYLHGKGVEQIIFCGMMSHMCIDATVRAAFDKGFTCVVADDACATRDLSHGGVNVTSLNVHASYMAALSSVYANVINSKEIIEQMST